MVASQAQAPATLLLRDTTQDYSRGHNRDVLAVRRDSVAKVPFAQATAPA